MAASHLLRVPGTYSKKGLHNPYEFIGFLRMVLRIPMNLYGFEDDVPKPYELIRVYMKL